jgi:threonine dehydratase
MTSTERPAPLLSLADVQQARDRIRPYVAATPLINYRRLDALVDANVWVKHENHHDIGSFKARGALNAVLAHDGPIAGLVAASAGNHGQGTAKAARLVGVPSCIVVPSAANETKVVAMEALGAEIVVGGSSAATCNAVARSLATDREWMIVDDFCDPFVMAGAGTIALEILEERPDVEVIVVPVGGGALAAGCCVAAKGLSPSVLTVGVGAAGAPATIESWRTRAIVEAPCHTIADGLAVDRPDEAVVATLAEHLDRGVLVSDDQLRDAMLVGIDVLHTLLEPSGAAGLAALTLLAAELAGRTVAVVATGANVAPSVLRQVLEPSHAGSTP